MFSKVFFVAAMVVSLSLILILAVLSIERETGEVEAMRETKHTPLPWEIFENQHVLCIMKAGTRKEVVHWAGFDSSDFLDQNSANAKLIVTSVNARPKVEELLGAARDAYALLGLLGHGRGFDSREASTFKRLEESIREVEAALGGKAE
ncbi:hypothetical protein LCGC14_0928280 [marine sediment metagenome]|uniref:Uncharacterized protein n=1 Tax=marine sediment metagenome TaxID=412755 RepID=A0A0F9RVB5_9ZZZZ